MVGCEIFGARPLIFFGFLEYMSSRVLDFLSLREPRDDTLFPGPGRCHGFVRLPDMQQPDK